VDENKENLLINRDSQLKTIIGGKPGLPMS